VNIIKDELALIFTRDT